MSPATFPVSVGNNANSGESQGMKAHQNKPKMKLLNVWRKTYVRSQQLFVIFFSWTWIVDEIVGNGGDLGTGYFPKKTKPAKPSTETVFEICASMRKLSIIILQTILFVSFQILQLRFCVYYKLKQGECKITNLLKFWMLLDAFHGIFEW